MPKLFRLGLFVCATSLLSGCFLNPSFWLRLEDLKITSAQLGKDCSVLPPPSREGEFACPFGDNPYLTTERNFIDCLYENVLEKEMKLPPELKNQTESLLLQGYQDSQMDSAQLGMYGFKLQSEEQAIQLQKAIVASAEQDIQVWQQGAFTLVFWNDAGDQGQCFQNLQTLLKKRLGRE